METKDLPLNMPCSDPEGCKHFKDAMKFAERIKELEAENKTLRQSCDNHVAINRQRLDRIKELEQALKGE